MVGRAGSDGGAVLTKLQQGLLGAVLAVTALLAAYRVVVVTQADLWAQEDPERALRWAPDHPGALFALAERQLASGQHGRAVATARHLLSVEPLEGRGFRVLAQAAQQAGDLPQALALYRIAARRSPRDVVAHAWLTQHDLNSGDYQAALQRIDLILRISPRLNATLLPILANLAGDPGFAIELVRSLQARPSWREGFLNTLQAGDDAQATQRVLSALQHQGGLSEAEFDRWIEHLISKGRWGEAYSRWAGPLAARKLRLTPVYNGGFESPPSNRGFDWRVTRLPGVVLQFVPDTSAKGLAAHASFRNRPVPGVNLEQLLLLAPGRYRLQARMRADALRSERGLEWVVLCAGSSEPVAVSDRVQGTFGWRGVGADFTVPATGCEGQWLRLRNPAPAGSAQLVSGDLWFDDVTITPVVGEWP